MSIERLSQQWNVTPPRIRAASLLDNMDLQIVSIYGLVIPQHVRTSEEIQALQIKVRRNAGTGSWNEAKSTCCGERKYCTHT